MMKKTIAERGAERQAHRGRRMQQILSRLLASAMCTVLAGSVAFLAASAPTRAQAQAYSNNGKIIYGGQSGSRLDWYFEPDNRPSERLSFDWKCTSQTATLRLRTLTNQTVDLSGSLRDNGKSICVESVQLGGQRDRWKALAVKHAPVIYLAEGEKFLPSSIDYFAQHVRAVCGSTTIAEDIMTLRKEQLPGGTGENCHFVTRAPMNGPYHVLDFMYGMDPVQFPVPVYVFFYPDEGAAATDLDGSFYAQYMTFYPYNLGKNVCPTFAPGDECAATRKMMGHHVGDWELMTIRFVEGKPFRVHVGAHGNDFPYTARTFRAPNWLGGGDGSPFSITMEAPRYLNWDGDHPVVYSASGSHGIYGWTGTQNYLTTSVGDRFNDYTSPGLRWETWKIVIFADDPHTSVLLNDYQGRWGNPHMGQSACQIATAPGFACSLLGIPTNEFQLNDGPHLPDRRRDKPFMD
jgi:hypothetical protein